MSSGTSLQLIAMHGWCGDSRGWDPWLSLWQQRGWQWCCGERGYGSRPPLQPDWPTAGRGRRVVIAHSLGPHLLPQAVLAAADAVVLLTSFGRFVPEGRAGRPVRSALAGMAEQLTGPEPGAMLQSFLQQVAAPASAEALPATPAAEPLSPKGLTRLSQDLELIGQCAGLPPGFPPGARVLLLQAGADQIVVPEARRLLEQALPMADVLTLASAGHGLIGTPTLALVTAWMEGLEP